MSKAADYIRTKAQRKLPEIGLILGSGLNDFGDENIENAQLIPYSEIPEFLPTSVSGHKGNFIMGEVGDVSVMCMQGRFHVYEGHSLQDVTLPVRVMAELGMKTLIVTNAAGGINPDFDAGDLMIITDHINCMGGNPLVGMPLEKGTPRFPDMTHAYDKSLIDKTLSSAVEIGIPLRKGVYVANTGPSFETPAEIRMYSKLGIDAVGMSTVPEVIVARQRGVKILGISLISNKAAGLSDELLTEKEVFETAAMAKTSFAKLITQILSNC